MSISGKSLGVLLMVLAIMIDFYFIVVGGLYQKEPLASWITLLIMGLLMLDTFWLRHSKQNYSSYIQGAIYTLIFIVGDTTLATLGILAMIAVDAHNYKPTNTKPRILAATRFNVPWGLGLLLLMYVLDFADVQHGLMTIAELPKLIILSLQMLFLLAIAQVTWDVLTGKLREIETQLAQQEKSWTLNLMSLLSHNIRTPLASLTNRIQIAKLKAQSGKHLSTTDIESLEKDNDRVMSIVHQLLNKTARNTLRKPGGTQELSHLIHRLSSDRITLINPEKLDFNLSISYAITLELCLDSLLSNALKHSDTPVEIIMNKSDTFYSITVKDRGRGMNADEAKQYGTPFYSNHNSTGTGLGVYLILELVKSQQWNWDLKTSPGKGTEVKISIPFDRLLTNH